MSIGGSTAQQELALMTSQRASANPIKIEEYQARISKLREKMKLNGIDVVYLDASSNLYYFTGLRCYQSERLHGALVSAQGELVYVCPAFEEQKTRASLTVDGDLLTWDEHESPTDAVGKAALAFVDNTRCLMALDDTTPFFIASRLQEADPRLSVINAEAILASCRRIKSDAEIALLKQAKAITLDIQRAAARILREGIDTRDVQTFLDDAHVACGMDGRSTFKIVLFGEATAYPHGVPYPQQLKEGDMVLIDTGATLHGYNSDITRSYVFGEPTARQREIWDIEKAAQAAAFDAAHVGLPCSAPDAAARKVIEASGLGPDYQVPGLPHRTGHGIGLDVHEHPYIVRGNELPLAPGMCFSVEPMICSYGEFGVRLEDHAYIDRDGPVWFTQPSVSIDNPLS